MSTQAPSDLKDPAPSRQRKKLFKRLSIVIGILAGLISLTVTLDTWYVSWQSARTAEQGLVTERFKDGVDELGSRDENVQAGGMFTLARVARDSPRDANTAYEVIQSFVRGHLCQNKVPQSGAPSGPPQSVSAGLQVLHQAIRHQAIRRIDLTRLKCDVFPADLAGVDLSGVHLEYAELPGANLQRANLKDAHLNNAYLDSTDFTHGARLTSADFTGADISSAGFRGSIGLTRNQLRRAHWSHRHPPYVNPSRKNWITR